MDWVGVCLRIFLNNIFGINIFVATRGHICFVTCIDKVLFTP
ncbi:MAG: hypothetical protein P857_851 [Candidatus Xenolissoclinum pacificiensis L6]|uniref:Uncharacterized protein n=1 Tax=Candidatus Xenolissoclinum pacificiensis L6 TaxID=1401685 RepID=W2UZT6_9RICK|nr:MAG: hypothetical protein P857_851 [Candidatus Xenolissoclinum pacificiensis L6]